MNKKTYYIKKIMGCTSNKNAETLETKRTNQAKIIDFPYEEVDRYFNNVSKSVCKIVISKLTGSGFLLSCTIEKENFYFLITNEHIISKSDIKKKETIIIYYDNEFKNLQINLNEDERYIRTFKDDIGVDLTAIEIISNDKIDNGFFLLNYSEKIEKNKLINSQIYIPQYPSGQKLKNARGIIKDIDNNEIIHLANTEKGSSGSPIFLVDSIKVIGIHKQGDSFYKENIGDFIYPALDEIYKDFSKKIYKKKNIKKLLNEEDYKCFIGTDENGYTYFGK